MQSTSTLGPALDPMTTLQNRWYNGLVAGLLASPAAFQIIQPAAPMPQTDTGLWAYENLVPPASLTFNLNQSGSGQFFDNYAAVVGQLQFPQSTFEHDIGADVYQQWTAYVAQQQPPPTLSQLPALFQSWAMRYAPSVVQVGTADLAAMALLDAAQRQLVPYQGPNAQPVDFAGGFAQLREALRQASGTRITFDSSDTSGDVSDTWTGGADFGINGLWAGYSGQARLSRVFARSTVTVTAAFGAYTVWTSVPGAWYDSSALNNAYSNQSSPPWPAQPDPTWAEVFGPHGSMQYLIASLLVADAVTVEVTSDATYSRLDQHVIQANASKGLWPFFIPSGAAATNTVSFSRSGMRIETVTQASNPLVVGANVLGIAQYLGHQPAPR